MKSFSLVVLAGLALQQATCQSMIPVFNYDSYRSYNYQPSTYTASSGNYQYSSGSGASMIPVFDMQSYRNNQNNNFQSYWQPAQTNSYPSYQSYQSYQNYPSYSSYPSYQSQSVYSSPTNYYSSVFSNSNAIQSSPSSSYSSYSQPKAPQPMQPFQPGQISVPRTNLYYSNGDVQVKYITDPTLMKRIKETSTYPDGGNPVVGTGVYGTFSDTQLLKDAKINAPSANFQISSTGRGFLVVPNTV